MNKRHGSWRWIAMVALALMLMVVVVPVGAAADDAPKPSSEVLSAGGFDTKGDGWTEVTSAGTTTGWTRTESGVTITLPATGATARTITYSLTDGTTLTHQQWLLMQGTSTTSNPVARAAAVKARLDAGWAPESNGGGVTYQSDEGWTLTRSETASSHTNTLKDANGVQIPRNSLLYQQLVGTETDDSGVPTGLVGVTNLKISSDKSSVSFTRAGSDGGSETTVRLEALGSRASGRVLKTETTDGEKKVTLSGGGLTTTVELPFTGDISALSTQERQAFASGTVTTGTDEVTIKPSGSGSSSITITARAISIPSGDTQTIHLANGRTLTGVPKAVTVDSSGNLQLGGGTMYRDNDGKLLFKTSDNSWYVVDSAIGRFTSSQAPTTLELAKLDNVDFLSTDAAAPVAGTPAPLAQVDGQVVTHVLRDKLVGFIGTPDAVSSDQMKQSRPTSDGTALLVPTLDGDGKPTDKWTIILEKGELHMVTLPPGVTQGQVDIAATAKLKDKSKIVVTPAYEGADQKAREILEYTPAADNAPSTIKYYAQGAADGAPPVRVEQTTPATDNSPQVTVIYDAHDSANPTGSVRIGDKVYTDGMVVRDSAGNVHTVRVRLKEDGTPNVGWAGSQPNEVTEFSGNGLTTLATYSRVKLSSLKEGDVYKDGSAGFKVADGTIIETDKDGNVLSVHSSTVTDFYTGEEWVATLNDGKIVWETKKKNAQGEPLKTTAGDRNQNIAWRNTAVATNSIRLFRGMDGNTYYESTRGDDAGMYHLTRFANGIEVTPSTIEGDYEGGAVFTLNGQKIATVINPSNAMNLDGSYDAQKIHDAIQVTSPELIGVTDAASGDDPNVKKRAIANMFADANARRTKAQMAETVSPWQAFTSYEGFGALSPFLIPKDTLRAWGEGVDKLFQTFMLGTDYWSSAVCKLAVSFPGNTGFIENADGTLFNSAHIEGSRQRMVRPPAAGQLEERYLYTFTYYIDAVKDDVSYTVLIDQQPYYLQGGMKAWKNVSEGNQEAAVGGEARVFFSTTKYEHVCLEFEDDPFDMGGKTLCSDFTDVLAEPTAPYEAAAADGNTTLDGGAGSAGVNPLFS